MDFGPTSMEKETFGPADGTCFARDADAGPSGTSADAADRSFVSVARGAVVLIEGRARRVDDSKNELGRTPIEDLRPADRKSRFRCSPRSTLDEHDGAARDPHEASVGGVGRSPRRAGVGVSREARDDQRRLSHT